MPRAIFLTALDIEYQFALEQLTEISRIDGPSGEPYRMGKLETKHPNNPFKHWDVLVAMTGDGNPESATLTEKLIHSMSPDVMFYLGVAGGLHDDVSLFDVVVGTDVTYYERGKQGEGFVSRNKKIPCDWRLLKQAEFERRSDNWFDRLKGYGINELPLAHFSPVAAGEKVLTDHNSSIVKEIKKVSNKAAAVEMEGYGFMHSMYTNTKPGLIIRGISDKLNDKNSKGSEADTARQRRASISASAFAATVLENYNYQGGEKKDDRRKITLHIDGDISEVNVGSTINEIKLFSNDGTITTVSIKKGSCLLELEVSPQTATILELAQKLGILSYMVGRPIVEISGETDDLVETDEVSTLRNLVALLEVSDTKLPLREELTDFIAKVENEHFQYQVFKVLSLYLKHLSNEDYYQLYSPTWVQGIIDSLMNVSEDMKENGRFIPIELTGVRLDRLDFSERKLNGANFSYSQISDCVFDQASLTDFRGESGQFDGSSFANADLLRADFTGSSLSASNFSGARCVAARFDRTVLSGALFANANVEAASFEGANLDGVVELVPSSFGASPSLDEEFTVWLHKTGSSKINVIKEVRGVTGLDLKNAKDLVEGAMPQKLKTFTTRKEADALLSKLRELGAQADLTDIISDKIDYDQDEYSVILHDVGGQKINVIKEVRAVTGLSLKETKDLVESAPQEIKVFTNKSDADALIEKLREQGAQADYNTERTGKSSKTFEVSLSDAGKSKISVIKEVRGITGLGLREAKLLVEETPSSVRTYSRAEDAEKAVEKLRAAGADAEYDEIEK